MSLLLIAALQTTALAGPTDADVRALFATHCVACHSPDNPQSGLDLQSSLPLQRHSIATGRILVSPGEPDRSYLLDKVAGAEGITGAPMPLALPALSDEEQATLRDWVTHLDEDQTAAPPPPPAPPFAGTHQIALHTTTTLGRHTLGFRVHHRFGRFGKAGDFGGLDGGAVMSLGLSYGILDGWDVLLRRTNSHKDYELGTKFVPLRQEDGAPMSLGAYASVEYLDDKDRVARHWVGNAQLLASRQLLSHWSAQLVVGFSSGTNQQVAQVLSQGGEPQTVEDTRGTLGLGMASTVWVDRRRRWGIDGEYLWPVRGGDPDTFYFRGGDADPNGASMGHWGLGMSNHIGLHVFQVMLTNNREIHTNLVAPGGQLGKPLADGGNFYVGFNLSRWWKLPRKAPGASQ